MHKIIVDVVLNRCVSRLNIAAGSRIKKGDFDTPLTEQELDAYSIIVDRLCYNIYGRTFDVIRDGQSDISYSYYISFIAERYLDDTEKPELWEIEFRISEHYNSSTKDDFAYVTESSKRMFKNFFINTKVISNVNELYSEFNNLLDLIQAGKYDDIQRIYGNAQ